MTVNHLIAIPTQGESKVLLFWVYSQFITEESLKGLQTVLSDSVDQSFWVNPSVQNWKSILAPSDRLQINHFKTGVTDNPAHSFTELLSLHLQDNIHVASGEAFILSPNEPDAPHNPLIHESKTYGSEVLENHFSIQAPKLSQGHAVDTACPESQVEMIDLRPLNRAQLETLSKNRFWALSADEMEVIQNHFDRPVTDVEIEILAQSWSEHCKHKIFAANIDYEDSSESFTVNGLFKSYIAQPTEVLRKKKDWAISVFKDNAGICRFDDELDVTIKVETHNSPSALDPYGGALTGILGVNRDILGTGLGSKPIANTNVLCFGSPHEKGELPIGLLHPKTVLTGVHRGIQDGGNKSGIPTVNGAMLFDDCFAGKPLVYCGTIGVIPHTINGIPSASKNHEPGHQIVMIGGAVGADGLHGATSSSLEMDQSTPSSMVQIGDPLTQKRMMDFLLKARDQGLYSSLTDNGAGGLSSSIGEMAEQTNGAQVWLERVPLKVDRLLPWEIFLSESQERMTLAVPKKDIKALLELAELYSVQATVVGEFNDSGKLEVQYSGKTVADLDLHFLHEGLPKMKLKAKWAGPQEHCSWKSDLQKQKLGTVESILKTVLAHPSIASKEPWIRQYDHEVQSATAVKPFEGSGKKTAPNDSGLIWLGPHQTGPKRYNGIGIGSGICPDFSTLDAGLMAKLAADEAVRNLICTGVNPDQVALVDNFCWPDPIQSEKTPDGEHKLAQLVRCCRELAKLVLAYEMPLVSGKDSMKNDFTGKLHDQTSVKISVHPTLLVTAVGAHPDVRRAIKPHAKAGSVMYLISESTLPSTHSGYFGVTLPKLGYPLHSNPHLDTWHLKSTRDFYGRIHQAQSQDQLIQSMHDLSEGGLAVALFESLLLNSCGITLDSNVLGSIPEHAISALFSEQPARFLVSIKPEQEIAFLKHFKTSETTRLGELNDSGKIELKLPSGQQESLSLSDLESVYRGAL